MIADLWKNFKGERKLTFSHWRYILLHWFFGVWPKTPSESSLPKVFYTHYCPLFHITNLIAIFSPVILFWKCVRFAVVAMYQVVSAIFGVIGAGLAICGKAIGVVIEKNAKCYLEKRRAKLAARRAAAMAEAERRAMLPPTEREIQEQLWLERRKLKKLLASEKADEYLRSFDLLWYTTSAVRLSREEGQEIWQQFKVNIEKAKEQAEARRKRIYELVVFWSNFGRIFVKGLLNVAYVAFALGVVYAAYNWIPPAVMTVGGWFVVAYHWVGGLFDAESTAKFWAFVQSAASNIGYYGGWAIGVLAAIVTLSIILVKIGTVLRKPILSVADALGVVLSPIGKMMGGVLGFLGMGILHILVGIFQFIVFFYEENCPPVTIIDKE